MSAETTQEAVTGLERRLMEAVDRFEDGLADLAPELIGIRIRGLRVELLDALGEGDGEAGDAPEPPLPDGIFGRIELPGRRNHTGWIADEPRFGIQMAVVRDWDGNVIAEVGVGPLVQIVRLPTPLKRPEPPKAITAGRGWFGADFRDDDEDDDET